MQVSWQNLRLTLLDHWASVCPCPLSHGMYVGLMQTDSAVSAKTINYSPLFPLNLGFRSGCKLPPVAAVGIFLQKKTALSPKLCSAVWLWLSAKNQVTSQLQPPPSGDGLMCGRILIRARPKWNTTTPCLSPGALSIVVCTDGRKLEESLQCSSCQEL